MGRERVAPPERWAVLCGPDPAVVYAQRPTRAEAERVREEQYHLAAKFGLPVRVVQVVVALRRR